MKKLSYIIQPDQTAKICGCGSDLFYLTRGNKKRNQTKNSWEETAYYIETCGSCGKREDQTIYDWRTVRTMKGGE